MVNSPPYVNQVARGFEAAVRGPRHGRCAGRGCSSAPPPRAAAVRRTPMAVSPSHAVGSEATGPPWRLLSPDCVVYTVRSVEQLEQLARMVDAKASNFKQLVGLNKNSSATPPQHKAGWQLVERVRWIARDAWQEFGTVAPVPMCGANGRDWVQRFFAVHGDAVCSMERGCIRSRTSAR